MKNRSPFELGLMIFFICMVGVALLGFAGIIPLPGGDSGQDPQDAYLGTVTMWGTLPKSAVSNAIEAGKFKKRVGIKYSQKSPVTFDKELTEALSNGVGPDMILLPQDLIYRNRRRISPLPYTSMSAGTFRGRFIQEAELYLGAKGILAMPLTVDPIVMYWNHDLFSSAGIIDPPTTWSQFIDEIIPKITIVDYGAKVKRSGIAFGEFDNVTHAKDIISLLIMQAGNPIVTLNANSTPSVVLASKFDYDVVPAEEALQYYTQFSNPSQDVYSWNRTLPSSEAAFLAGDLAVYFGYASEYEELQRKNPHLNFGIASVPQRDANAKQKITFGRMQGVSVLNVSKHKKVAFAAMVLMSNPQFISTLSESLGLPPVRKDLLAKKQDVEKAVSYQMALQARAWLDPQPDTTDDIFRQMVEDIVSKRTSVSGAISAATAKLQRAL